MSTRFAGRSGGLRACVVVSLTLLFTGQPQLGWSDVDPAAKARARQHYKNGKAAFELGKFGKALKQYEKAYQILPLPGFLFNIGQCHRNLNLYEKAIFSFRLYLRKKPNATNRSAVETLIEDLEVKAEEERKRKEKERATKIPHYKPEPKPEFIVQPPPRHPPPRPPPPKPFYKQWWFWVPVAAVAVAGGAVGTYFAVRPQEASMPSSSLGVWDLSR